MSLGVPAIKAQNCPATSAIMGLSALVDVAPQKAKSVAHFGHVLRLARRMLIAQMHAAPLDIVALKMYVMEEKLLVTCARKTPNVRA